jgi:hypothetical protein
VTHGFPFGSVGRLVSSNREHFSCATRIKLRGISVNTDAVNQGRKSATSKQHRRIFSRRET